MQAKIATTLIVFGALAGFVLADHHHHVNIGANHGSARVGTAGTGHAIYTHAKNGRAYAVTLHNGRQHIRHQRIMRKGGGGGVQNKSEGVIRVSSEVYLDESGQAATVAASAQYAWIGFAFYVFDSSNNAHWVVIWLPITQVDPSVA